MPRGTSTAGETSNSAGTTPGRAADTQSAHAAAPPPNLRHAARSIKWAIFGFVAGLVLLVATFTKVLALGFVGFLVMLACLLVIERNARKLGKAGMDNLTSSFRSGSVGGVFGSAGRRMRERWRRDDTP